MERRKPVHSQRRVPDLFHTQAVLALMAASAATPIALLAYAFPRPLVLPVLCLIALVGAGIACVIAWRSHAFHQSHQVTSWDVAGALVFVGCAAAILSDPMQLIQYFANPTAVTETR